jgi:glutathione S-transferase
MRHASPRRRAGSATRPRCILDSAMNAPTMTLAGEAFSPWTEKARWALDHHRIAYRYEEYTPLVSEPWLRFRAHRLRGPISVPFLLGPDGLRLHDSFAIACEADRRSDGRPPLVPDDRRGEITTWNERSERIMRAGRAQILSRSEESREIQIESLPPGMPRGLRRLLAPTVRVGTAYLRKKYAVRPVTDEELEVDLAPLRSAIATAPSGPLLGRFTLADIAMACALQAVRPHPHLPVGLQPAQRAGWERPALADRWQDVLAWRDAIVETAARG